MTIDVYHNVASPQDRPLVMLTGYQPGDPLVKVATLTVPAELAVDWHRMCEWAFWLLNVGDEYGDPQALAYREARNRSLSVGDVIVIDGVAYGCAAVGWERVQVSPHQLQERA